MQTWRTDLSRTTVTDVYYSDVFSLYADLGQWYVKKVGVDHIIEQLGVLCITHALCLESQVVSAEGVQSSPCAFATFISGGFHVARPDGTPEAWVAP